MISLLTQCTIEKRYKVLSFLFDGVPNPNDTTIITNTQSNNETDSAMLSLYNSKQQTFTMHPPYQEKSCSECHILNKSQLIIKQPDLCFNCHENFIEENLFTHGPAAGGYCTACHEPHKSKNEKLLTDNKKEICNKCHNSVIFKNGDFHSNAGDLDCTECHDSHGGDNKYFVKVGVCKNCHDDFSKKYSYLHGPVSSGFCSSCHDSHDSETPSHLLFQGQAICTNCHELKQVSKNHVHEDIGDTNCTECHNPHGGTDKFILN